MTALWSAYRCVTTRKWTHLQALYSLLSLSSSQRPRAPRHMTAEHRPAGAGAELLTNSSGIHTSRITTLTAVTDVRIVSIR